MSTDTTQAGVALRGRNPDVLTCIANLSNDEVFTPPELANKILDAVADRWAANNGGADIWSDPTVRFLDPFTKSGVFSGRSPTASCAASSTRSLTCATVWTTS